MQLLSGLQFDICYVIKTRVRFGIAQITRLLNYIGNYSFALKNVNLKILENSLECAYSEVIFYITFKCKVINVEFFSRDFYFQIFLVLFSTVPSQSTLTSQEVFHDYQVSLENTTNQNSSL